MGRGSSGMARHSGGGLDPNDIKGTREMVVERGQHGGMVDEVLSTARDMMNEYGEGAIAQELQIATLKPGASAIAYYDGSNVAVNEKYMNKSVMEQAYADCVRSGFHPSNGNKTAMQAVTAHEFGHALTDACGKKMGVAGIDNIATRIVNEAKKGSGSRGVVQFASKISGYATHSNAEAIAEAVSDVYCNGSKAKSESIAIVNTMKKYL